MTYTPVKHGFIQDAPVAQMATANAGQPAFASDYALMDSAIVGEAGQAGLEAGLAVVAKSVTNPVRIGLNQFTVSLPETGATGADIYGVVVRNAQMKSNAAGRPCWFKGDLCTVARAARSGARIWARVVDGAAPTAGSAAYVAIGGNDAGKFADSTANGAVAVTTMRFMSEAKNGIALIELL